MVALVKRKERPELPEDLGALPGGAFGSISAYMKLMQKCWAERPEERPSFEAVITELRALLEQCKADRLASRTLQGWPPATPPASPISNRYSVTASFSLPAPSKVCRSPTGSSLKQHPARPPSPVSRLPLPTSPLFCLYALSLPHPPLR